MSHWIDLRGATALVTGGSRGIGAAIVRVLAACGARCAVNYVADPDGRNRTDAGTVVAAAPGAFVVEGDVSEPVQVARIIGQAVAEFGGLDILVNNAGIIRDRSLRKMSADEWDAVLRVNLSGVFNVIQAATPHLRPGGRVVNLASVSASLGFFGQANYAASKAGVMALTRVAARELAKQQVRVNAVAPGLIDTEMTRTMPPDVLAKFVEQVPLGRGGTPDDVAGVVLFLCSPMSAYVTGQVIHVNGGFFMAG
jgi:3-oxoacyl-[acyl-carrier protein] reductase